MTARRALVLSVATLLCAALGFALVGSRTGAAADPVSIPPGPRLAVGVLHLGQAEASTELVTIGPAGEDPQAIAHGTGFPGSPEFRHPNWNADGTELAVLGPGHETSAVYVGGIDEGRLRLLPDSEHLGGRADATLPDPLFDPRSGDLIVAVVHTPHGEGLFGDGRPSDTPGVVRREFWALPVDGRRPHRLSSRPVAGKRASILYPDSVAPGGKVVATMLSRRGFGVAIADPRSGAVRTVVPTTTQQEGTLEPAISPDGKEIVYKVDKQKGAVDEGGLIGTELMIVPTAGGTPKPLAWIKGGAESPSWDPSGSRIAFTVGDAVMEMNADGSCPTKVYSLGRTDIVQGAAWQPGADRGAGPLSC